VRLFLTNEFLGEMQQQKAVTDGHKGREENQIGLFFAIFAFFC
jgi:hypothetical protein